jgi:4'-phosphopantetheinyl transferase
MQRPEEDWKAPPATIKLLSDEIHLWRIDLESVSNSRPGNESPLSDDEMARAKKFRFERDRRRFAETRIALRKILSRYTLIPPDEIEFSYCENRKPELAEPQNLDGLRFNLSHSGQFGIVGISLRRRIGVDVEQYRALEFLDIARRYFSEREYRELALVSAQDLQRCFFSCWTCKEAVLKALGEGLGSSLDKISVSIGSPRLIEFSGMPNSVEQWSLIEVDVHPDYAAAVAVEAEILKVHQLDYSV